MQVHLATCVLRGATTLFFPTGEVGYCRISAGLGVQVLAAVIDMAMPPLSGAWRAQQGSSSTAAAAELTDMDVSVQQSLVYWQMYMAAQPGGEQLMEALLEEQRLLLWFECMEKMQGGRVAALAAALLLKAVTTDGQEGGGIRLRIPASKAAQVCTPRGLTNRCCSRQTLVPDAKAGTWQD